MEFIDSTTHAAVIDAFSKKLLHLPPGRLDQFIACFDLKKKEGRKRQREQVVLEERDDGGVRKRGDVLVGVVGGGDAGVKQKKQSLNRHESDFLDTLGEVCMATSSPTPITTTPPPRLQSKPVKKRSETLKELEKMEERVRQIIKNLGECSSSECSSSECSSIEHSSDSS